MSMSSLAGRFEHSWSLHRASLGKASMVVLDGERQSHGTRRGNKPSLGLWAQYISYTHCTWGSKWRQGTRKGGARKGSAR
jgi:hypothetical protein